MLRDVLRQEGIDVQDLRTILDEYADVDGILFVDDNIGSGKQSVQIFREWMNIGDRVLNEYHVAPLTVEQRGSLGKKDIHVLTCVASRQGQAFVKAGLVDLGLNVKTVAAFADYDEQVGCFHPAVGVFPDSETRGKAEAMCRDIGAQLLSDKRWPAERKANCALGYGNVQSLVVFFYNVPTTTLPVLWKSGKFRGREWFPLFPRREKV